MSKNNTPISEPQVTKSGRKKIVSTAKGTLTMMAMAILLITSIFSLRGLPSEAKYGIQSIFFFIFAAVVFLIPFSLVCAELASTYTKSGGLYRWVAEAFGPKWGWTAMYLEWQTMAWEFRPGACLQQMVHLDSGHAALLGGHIQCFPWTEVGQCA